MATITKLSSGRWRVQIRRRRSYVSRCFRLKGDATAWALEAESAVEAGKSIDAARLMRGAYFGTLVDLHATDMAEVGKAPRRSKAATLAMLKTCLGDIQLTDLSRERLIAFGKTRAKDGAGPVTLSADLGYVRTILVHAAAVHGLPFSIDPVTLARVALRRHGQIGKGRERERRPTRDELQRIILYNDNNPRQTIPVGRLVKFAVATAMRIDEICQLSWQDVDLDAQLATVRDRKDPRHKIGNDQQVPLLDVTGYDACALLVEQRAASPRTARVFPYNSRSVGTAFRRTCRALGIVDLHFHDLRHEGTSRLFEGGLDIPEVALVTGHKDWKMLRRYLNLRPQQLVERLAAQRSRSPYQGKASGRLAP